MRNPDPDYIWNSQYLLVALRRERREQNREKGTIVSEVYTLGKYRDLCATIGGESCEAVAFLDAKIKTQGREAQVIADESQMLQLLGPMMTKTARKAIK